MVDQVFGVPGDEERVLGREFREPEGGSEARRDGQWKMQLRRKAHSNDGAAPARVGARGAVALTSRRR